MADTEPLMYAELLSNIHQISVVVALETECNHKTKAYLSADGVQFTIHHEGKDTTLNLPGEVASKRQLQLDIPSKGSKELSWRFPVAGTPQRADLDLSLSHDAPWPAKDLGAAVEFHCRGCQAVLVKEGAVKEWRDLPSENWAEMMDFWHCHKPEQPANETARPDGLENRKGYGANTKFNAQPGIGFVDVATFLLSAADLPDVKLPNDSSSNQTLLCCPGCNKPVGYTDAPNQGLRLTKWSLSLNSSTTPSPSHATLSANASDPTPCFVSSLLSALVASQCASRVILLPFGHDLGRAATETSTSHSTPISADSPAQLQLSSTTAHEDSLHLTSDCPVSSSATPPNSATFVHLWILSTSMRWTGSATSRPSASPPTITLPNTPSTTQSPTHSDPAPINPSTSTSPTQQSSAPIRGTHSIKVFWKPVDSTTANELVESSTTEDLFLPSDAIEAIRTSLLASRHVLPPSGRTFREWHVGLLERFD